jgi:hypothetical protein
MEYNHFSDEMQVVLGKNSRVYVWRKSEERWNTQCLGLYDHCYLSTILSVLTDVPGRCHLGKSTDYFRILQRLAKDYYQGCLCTWPS